MTDNTPDELAPDDGDVLAPAAATPAPTGRGRKATTPPAEGLALPAYVTEAGSADPLTPAQEADLAAFEGSPLAVTELLADPAFTPDPRPSALVAAANYYAGANVPDQLIIDKARRFERYLLEPRGEDWKPVSKKKARQAATEAEGVQA